MDSILIACTGAAAIPHDQLTPFQGKLKTLSNANYAKLKKEILELGFSEPISVWQDGPFGTNYVLNGHQRLTTIKRMVEEDGYKCDPLPVSVVVARDLAEAKRKVLSLASQYGKVDQEGLAEFLLENDISFNEFDLSFDMPGVDTAALEKALTDPADLPAGPPPKDPDTRNFNIGYNIAFDDLEQQQSWFELLRWLKIHYGDEPTIGAKLHAFSQDTRTKNP